MGDLGDPQRVREITGLVGDVAQCEHRCPLVDRGGDLLRGDATPGLGLQPDELEVEIPGQRLDRIPVGGEVVPVHDHASAAGVSAARTADFVLAINELVGNSVRHGGGGGELRLWREGDFVVGEVSDRGTITDPLAGRRRPTPDQDSGRGLWIANQVCDLVEIRSEPGATVVRAHVGR